MMILTRRFSSAGVINNYDTLFKKSVVISERWDRHIASMTDLHVEGHQEMATSPTLSQK